MTNGLSEGSLLVQIVALYLKTKGLQYNTERIQILMFGLGGGDVKIYFLISFNFNSKNYHFSPRIKVYFH